jgi:hypothetical protein
MLADEISLSTTAYEWGFWMGSFLDDGRQYPRFCGGGFIPGSKLARDFSAAPDQHRWLLEFERGQASALST